MIAPNSRIILLKCPIELDNNNQLTFSNSQNQYNYFYNLTKLELDEATFQRKDGVIRFNTDEEAPNGIGYEEILQYNYCMYQNINYGNKWFYAFITNVIWINNGLTDIEIKTDVFQTWQFDITWKRSFIEREHISKSNDYAGYNTLPENVETGEYINCIDIQFNYGSTYYYCIGVSEDIIRSDTTSIYHNKYNGIISGITYFILKEETDVNMFIFRYNNSGKIDAINSLFMIPSGYVGTPSWSTDATGTIHYQYVSNTSTYFDLGNLTISKPTIIGETSQGYTPVNKKLLTYPFTYLLADNNAGANIIYRFEDFKNVEGSPANTIMFNAIGTIIAGCNIKFIPREYKNVSYNYNESFNGAKIPVGSWTNDVFTNWLTQNGINIGLSIASSSIAGVGGAISGNPLQIASGFLGVSQTLGSIYEHSLFPNQAEGNITSSDTMFSVGKIAPTFYVRSIKIEYAKLIDHYFSAYGYATKEMKMPNLNNRSNWNFIKTIDANIIGDIPQNDMQEFKELFNKGITLWHNPNTFLDYSQNNN